MSNLYFNQVVMVTDLLVVSTTTLCPIRVKSITIELTVLTSCFCVLNLLCDTQTIIPIQITHCFIRSPKSYRVKPLSGNASIIQTHFAIECDPELGPEAVQLQLRSHHELVGVFKDVGPPHLDLQLAILYGTFFQLLPHEFVFLLVISAVGHSGT